MAVGIAFKFLKIASSREARNQKEAPQVKTVRKGTIRIEHTVASR